MLGLALNSKAMKVLLAVLIVLAVGVIIAAGTLRVFRRESTENEVRLMHLDRIVKILEAYHDRYGAYPQPTARREEKEGIKHVWGYEPDTISLATCSVAEVDEAIETDQSRCGGGIYDIDGNLIGWKGTLTLENALNSVALIGQEAGRPLSPLSDIASSIPIDPAFAKRTDLSALGFGEYVYAVRMPEDKSITSGGVEYQIAATMTDESTGKKTSIVRGNYFVRSSDQGTMPSSLIGPGILFDEFRNPLSRQKKPIHVIMDGQSEGYPHPSLGSGDDVLKVLMLEGAAERVLASIADRRRIMESLPESENTKEYLKELSDLETQVDKELASIRNLLPSADKKIDTSQYEQIPALEAEMKTIAIALSSAGSQFIKGKADEVQSALELEVTHREKADAILSDAMNVSHALEEDLLFARDEVLKYLRGDGIEDQTRNRTGKKLEDILKSIPDVRQLFLRQSLAAPLPFISEGTQKEVDKLSDTQKEGDDSGSLPIENPVVTLSTVATELETHLSELKLLVERIQNDLLNARVPLESTDDELSRLSQAMDTENTRISSLLKSAADVDTSQTLLTYFMSISDTNPGRAIADIAKLTKLNGDFRPLIFSADALEEVKLGRSPGIPDENYGGIPYRLP